MDYFPNDPCGGVPRLGASAEGAEKESPVFVVDVDVVATGREDGFSCHEGSVPPFWGIIEIATLAIASSIL